MRLDLCERDGVPVARLVGELTFECRGGRASARNRPAEAEGLVLDLGRLTFLDSAGIHLLFRLSRLVGARGGRLTLVVPPTHPSTA